MALANCIKRKFKFNGAVEPYRAIVPADQKTLLALADQYEKDGMARQEAELRAVDDHIADLKADREQMVGAVTEAYLKANPKASARFKDAQSENAGSDPGRSDSPAQSEGRTGSQDTEIARPALDLKGESNTEILGKEAQQRKADEAKRAQENAPTGPERTGDTQGNGFDQLSAETTAAPDEIADKAKSRQAEKSASSPDKTGDTEKSYSLKEAKAYAKANGLTNYAEHFDGLGKAAALTMKAADRAVIADMYAGKPYSIGEDGPVFNKKENSTDSAAVTQAWKLLSANDDAFQLPHSKETSLLFLAQDYDPNIEVTKHAGSKEYPQGWYITLKDKEGKPSTALLKLSSDNKVVLDISDFQTGAGGRTIYQIAGDFAHNNGYTFIGDPLGLSPIAQLRRTENMLSSALRWNTTDHLEPHPSQLKPGKESSVVGLKWKKGDTDFNIGELLRVTAENTLKAVPELANIFYNFESKQFEKTLPDGSSIPYSDGDFGRLARNPGSGARTAQAGSSTLKRAAYTHTLVRGEGSPQWSSILGHLVRQSSEQLDPQLKGLLYNRIDQTNAKPATAFDQLLYDGITQGKSTKDLLTAISTASKSRFNRELAKALMQTGITTTVNVGESAGQSFTVKGRKAEDFAAMWNPKTDTATLFEAKNAEKNALHELIHAATYRAIRKGGLPAVQLSRLFNHVTQNGAGKGMYGMSNVDEFIAEAFSNPKFQAMLKGVDAAKMKDGKLQSAFDWFTNIVRQILGLGRDQNNALSQAMEIGAALMTKTAQANAAGRATTAAMATNDVVGNQSGAPADDERGGARATINRTAVNSDQTVPTGDMQERTLRAGKPGPTEPTQMDSVAASKANGTPDLRVVDLFNNGSRVQYFDDSKGLYYESQRYLSGKTKWRAGEVIDGQTFWLADKEFDTMDEAIKSVRYLRASNTGKANDQARYGDIPNLWQGESKKIAKAIIDAGFEVDRFSRSTQSASKYIYLTNGVKVRIADHVLPSSYEQADVDVRYGDDIKGIVSATQAASARLNESPAPNSDGASDGLGRDQNNALSQAMEIGAPADDNMGADQRYPIAGDTVDGRVVRDSVPNMSSISASLDDYTILPGVREIPMSAFTLTGKSYSVSETERIDRLAERIKESGEINPLIVVIDAEGPYILEGGHRAEALYKVSAKSFPAIVVTDDSVNESPAPNSDGASDALGNARDEAQPATEQGESKIVGRTQREYSAAQLEAMKNVGFQVTPPTLKERAQALWKDAGKKLAQGLADQFAPVKDISKEAYGLLRLSKGASGAFEAMLKGGQLKLTDGVYDFDESKRGGVIDKLLKPLQGEQHDFLRWVAANRAERLIGEGKENLFSPDDIAALKTLSDGETKFDYTMQTGPGKGKVTRSRKAMYDDSNRIFNEFHKNVLDMAEQSGLIDPEARAYWENEFYVPFYRVEDDGSIAGANIKNGVVRQQAFKSLTGRDNKLNADLLDNTLMNWAHLLDAAAKNRAAKATIEAAENMKVAAKIDNTVGKGSVWFMENGEKRWSFVDDPYLMTAITALQHTGMNGPMMKAMGAMKHALTMGVTASPFFKVRNLIRDSVQAIGTSDLSYNVAANIAQGWKLTDPKSDAYFRLLAGGGTIHFGSMYEGSEAKRVQSLVESGVDASSILDSDQKVKAFYSKFIAPSLHAYKELGDRGEAINRAALYEQLIKQGMNHAEASLQARDLMDFSMQGSFTTIRFLTQVVPFMNARIQGLYKLGKSAKEDPAKFATVLGSVALISVALLAAYHDDDDWKKREDWDRNNFWWMKFGGTAFRIPKPFEIGAIATLAERGFELAFDKEMTNKRFLNQVMTLLGDNLSMNPIPQLVKPMLDVYSNKDAFTGRPIETMGMEKLKPDYRFNAGTSMTARGLSTAANSVTNLVNVDSPSPVQIDHLMRGYFGWIGSFVVGAGDVLARPATNQPTKAAPDMWKTATGGMVSDLRDAPSRYVSQMYTQAKELEQAYGTWHGLLKEGKVKEAAEFFEANKQDLIKYKPVEHVKQTEAKLNAYQKVIERSDMPPDVKRDRIREIQIQKDRLARMIA